LTYTIAQHNGQYATSRRFIPWRKRHSPDDSGVFLTPPTDLAPSPAHSHHGRKMSALRRCLSLCGRLGRGPGILQQQKVTSPLQKYRALTPSAQLLQNHEGKNFKKPKAVIFDLGGVVVPSPLPIFQQFEAKYGLKEGSLVDTIKLSGEDGAFAKLERGEISVECFSEPFARGLELCV